MSSFDERQNRFESEFAHDQEAKFKIEARRNRLVAAWAAEKLGKSGDEAEEYAKSVIRADLQEPGDNDVFEKLRGDLPKSDVSDDEIREAMGEALAAAMEEARQG
ncbi:MAG: DUF1476 domain-containing protein [Parvularculaceae bacterium]|nr:DUF1476 domain-containing protein [Parvularculaceae bacterium]